MCGYVFSKNSIYISRAVSTALESGGFEDVGFEHDVEWEDEIWMACVFSLAEPIRPLFLWYGCLCSLVCSESGQPLRCMIVGEVDEDSNKPSV